MKGYELFVIQRCRRSVGEFEFSVGVSNRRSKINRGQSRICDINKMAQEMVDHMSAHSQEKKVPKTPKLI